MKIDIVSIIYNACMVQGICEGMTLDSCVDAEIFAVNNTVYVAFAHGDICAYIAQVGKDGSIGEIFENN